MPLYPPLRIGSPVAQSSQTTPVIFLNGNKQISESASLSWDEANIRLGIGTNAPVTELHVLKSSLARTDVIMRVGSVANPNFTGPYYQNTIGQDITDGIPAGSPQYGYVVLEVSPAMVQNNSTTGVGYTDYIISGDFAPLVSGSGYFAGIQSNNLAPTYTGSGEMYDGIYGFNGAPAYSGSGTTLMLCAAYCSTLQTSGDVYQATGVFVNTMGRSGGTRDRDVSLFLLPQTNGQVSNIALFAQGWDSGTTGCYVIYSDGSAPSYHEGNLGIGNLPTTTSPLNIGGLPTSAAGLATGDVWVDTTGGLNVLKIK